MSNDAPELHRLRLGDLANLWAEDRNTPSQIALIGELAAEPLRDAAGHLDVQRVRAELARRVRRIPELGRRIHRTRRGEGQPVWVHDAAFDPLDHITAATLPAGTDLAAWCADRIVRRLDPARPLWRIEIVDGLPGGRFGLLIVLHHVLADGLTGVAIAGRLLDACPDDRAEAAHPSTESPVPTHRALVADVRRARRRAVTAALRAIPRIPSTLLRTVRQVRDAAGDLRETAPKTSLPRRVGPGRHLVVVRFPLEEVRAAGRTAGATINDVLLAAVTSGLRELLLARGERVDGLTLRASMPVGVTGAGQTSAMLLLGLPVGDPDPHRRLATITATTGALKARIRAGGGDVFDVLHLPAPLARLAVRWMRRRAARHINLFVTNVPGPPRPLWLAGARLLDATPVAPLAADVPVGIAALSYAGTLTVTVNADTAVSDVAVLAAGIGHALGAGVRAASSGAHDASRHGRIRSARPTGRGPSALSTAPRCGGSSVIGHRRRTAVTAADRAAIVELVELDGAECLRLLAKSEIGRVVYTDAALPAAQPVTYLLDGEEVVFRTGGGGKLAAATRGAVVAFQVDEIDPSTRTGWAVLGVGEAYEVLVPDRLADLATRMPHPWAPGRMDHTIAVPLQRLTGRRLVAVPADTEEERA